MASQLDWRDLLHLVNCWIVKAHDTGADEQLNRLLDQRDVIRNRIQADLDAADDAEREVAA